jgi:hypothetical protein
MRTTREKIIEARRRLKTEYGELFDAAAVLLFRYDPIGISFENPNTDEYEPEVGTILPRLSDCHSQEDVLRVVHEEFVRWFEQDTAGPPERYEKIAADLWQMWLDYLRGVVAPQARD